jgi:hypothetical protein
VTSRSWSAWTWCAGPEPARSTGEVSPDGLDHDPVVLRKMAETHLVEQAALCDRIILDFLEHEPVPTLAPIRRR